MLNSNKVRVGIIGCGGIAKAKHIRALSKLNAVELIAFFDRNFEKAKEFQQRFGTAESAAFGSLDEMLADGRIDVVHVCTSNQSHAPISIAAMLAGKHVMCEKPMALNAAEAKEMAAVAKRTGKKLTVAYQNRFSPDSEYLYKLCRRGDLGEIYFAKAHAVRRRAVPTWGSFLDQEKQGGGPLIDIGSHALDLTLWLMNNYEPKYAVGNVYNKFSSQQNTGNLFGNWDSAKFTVEDSAFGFITMKNGATIILESSWALNCLQTGENRATLCGTKAGADMQDGLRINGSESNRLYTKIPELLTDVDLGYLEAQAWIECILNDTRPVVLADQAAVVTEILEGIYKSSRTGTPYFF